MANTDNYLLLRPSTKLVFRGPFTDHNVCQLMITNTSSDYVGFKMKCTAAKYYTSNPAVGIVPPEGLACISVYLSELDGEDPSKIDYKKHKFGITYKPLPKHCTVEDVDRILRISSKDDLQIAYLQSVILAEGDDDQLLSEPSTRERLQTVTEADRQLPPKPAAKPIRRVHSIDREYQTEIKLKESVMDELKKENDELTKQANIKIDKLILELETKYKEERDAILKEQQRLRDDLLSQLAILKKENEKLQQIDTTACSDITFWEVSQNDFEINEHIGSGAWGYVARGLYKEQPVAVKCLHPNIVSPHSLKLLKREVIMMAKIRHPCLLLFIGVSFDHPSGSPMIITELMDCSLRDAYKRQNMLSGKSKIKIMIDIACALHYLHTHKEKILHRDLSSANVLVQETSDKLYRGKLSDFGSANIARSAVTAGAGAELYMAPEIPRETSPINVPQTSKIDVYSYGILLCELFASEPQLPFRDIYLSLLESIRNQFPFMYELILKCTSHNPDNRPEIIGVLCELRKIFCM